MAVLPRRTRVALAVFGAGLALAAGGCGSSGTTSTSSAPAGPGTSAGLTTSAGVGTSAGAVTSVGSGTPSSAAQASGPKTTVFFTAASALTTDQLNRELAIVKTRVASEKLSGVTVAVSPDRQGLVVQGPAADEDQLRLVGRPGVLGFRPVLATAPAGSAAGAAPRGVSARLWQQYTALDCKNPPTADPRPDAQIVACQNDGSAKFALDATAVQGTSITAAGASGSPLGGWQVDVSLNSEGASQFAQLTTRLTGTGGQVAIVLDGVVYSAPLIQSPITDGTLRIQFGGTTSQGAAQNLAAALQSGALPVALTVSDVSTTTG